MLLIRTQYKLLTMEGSLNYCSQNGGNLYRAPYYYRNLNIGPRIDSNLGQSPQVDKARVYLRNVLVEAFNPALQKKVHLAVAKIANPSSLATSASAAGLRPRLRLGCITGASLGVVIRILHGVCATSGMLVLSCRLSYCAPGCSS